MTDERIKILEEKVTGLEANYTQIAHSIINIETTLSSHFKDEKAMKEVLHKMDGTLNIIKLALSDSKFATYKLLQEEISPVFTAVRHVKDELSAFKIKAEVEHNGIALKIKKEMRDENKTHIKIIYTGLVLIVGLLGFIFDDFRKDFEAHTLQIPLSIRSEIALQLAEK